VSRVSILWPLVFLAACAAPRPATSVPVAPVSSILPAASAAPTIEIESPIAGSLVREPEVEVRGRFTSYDGRGWVYAEGTEAQVAGHAFIARRVPVREGAMKLSVELSDGQGRKARALVPLVVESPDRPRHDRLCRAGIGCLRYEARGVPRRRADGKITNAVLVLSAFGFDERLDALWPDLVGPGRALDSRRYYVIGLAGGPDEAGRLPGPDAMLALLEELITTQAIDRSAALIGASSYGAELALRVLAMTKPSGTTGPVLLCGGHDRPYEEPAMKRVQEVLQRARASHAAPLATWREVARQMVPASYTPRYLGDARHAVEHGLVEEAKRDGLGAALVERQAQHFLRLLPLAELERRMEAAFALERSPLAFPVLTGRRVILVANRDDQMMSLAQMSSLAQRLTRAGAQSSLRELGDELGHSAFFRRVPLELERAIEALLAPTP